MALSEQMLSECKDVIFNKSKLLESVKEPIHQAISHLMVLEHGYKDFLSREIAGEGTRGNILSNLIADHGGDPEPFIEFFNGYEYGTSGVWGG